MSDLSTPQAVMTRLCECGCGQPTKLAARTNRCFGHIKGQPLRFIRGHSGAANGNRIWYQDRRSKRWIVAGRDGKNYLWYRVLMENELGRSLGRYETVHHINGDCADDDLENLVVMSLSEHARLHAVERESWRQIAGKGHRWTSEEARVIGQRGAAAANAKRIPTFCTESDCDRLHYGRGLCQMHYMRTRRAKANAA